MKKNGTQLFRYTNLIQNEKIKMKYQNSKYTNQTMNFSFSKNKNKALSNFNLIKNYQISTNNCRDNSYRNNELYKSEISSVSQEKTQLENSVQSRVIFLRKLSAKNIRTKAFFLNKCNKKCNFNIIPRINMKLNEKKKIDFIKYKFLLAKNNYDKKLFQHDNVGSSSDYSKKINHCLIKNKNRYFFDFEKLKKFFFKQDDINAHSMKDENENYSISSFKDFKNNYNKKNIFVTDNYSGIKNTNNKTAKIFKKSRESLYDYKKSIPIKKINLFEKAKKIIKNKNNQEHKDNVYFNKSSGNKKIIDDNYKEYLKDISSSESNKSIKKNNKGINKSLEYLENKLSLKDKDGIFKRIKIIKKYNYSNININNNNKFFEFKKYDSDRRKNLNNNKIIIKTILIENPF